MINSSSEVNRITSSYTATLGLKAYSITIQAKKINSFSFSTYNMITTSLEIWEKLNKV